MHYHTQRILERVEDSYCSLHDGGLQVPGEDWPEPKKPDRALQRQLDALFESGAELAFEMDHGWADEGGNCYQAFILKPEFVKEWANRAQESNDPTFPAREYASAPGRYWIFWQGPY
jgi:hypothetical protein